jgi:hypothetical protein
MTDYEIASEFYTNVIYNGKEYYWGLPGTRARWIPEVNKDYWSFALIDARKVWAQPDTKEMYEFRFDYLGTYSSHEDETAETGRDLNGWIMDLESILFFRSQKEA